MSLSSTALGDRYAECTECHVKDRTWKIRVYAGCQRHRLCASCRPSQPRPGGTSDSCPICDEARRGFADARARARALSSPSKAAAQRADAFRDELKRNSAKLDANVRWLANLNQGNARVAKERTEQAAKAVCEPRETQEFRDGLRMLRERQAQPQAQAPAPARQAQAKQAQAPAKAAVSKNPPKKAVNVSAARPSSGSAPRGVDSKLAAVKAKMPPAQPKPTLKSTAAAARVAAGAAGVVAKRRVSFDPNVQRKFISPRENATRRSLPASSRLAGPSSSMGKENCPPPPLTRAASKRNAVEARTTHRGWGVSSP